MLTTNAYNMKLTTKGECRDDLHLSLVNARELYDNITDSAGTASVLSPEDMFGEILIKLKAVLGDITA